MLKPGRYEITIKAEDWPPEAVDYFFEGRRPRVIISTEIYGGYCLDKECFYFCTSCPVKILGLFFPKNAMLVSDADGFALMALDEFDAYPQADMKDFVRIPCVVKPSFVGTRNLFIRQGDGRRSNPGSG